MLLGVPGRIVDDGSVETCRLRIAYLPGRQVGDYPIAHAGFALTKIDAASALVTIVDGAFGEERAVPA